ncbi:MULTISPECIES: NACHT domain-containing protein [unclassified Rhodococcus (in: high G+C Gram-positive bacteria)]|uniref:NACHT domain-containing protein n=1 Tax=unclassified Rhodococcus (in: high G+C Gram-positive bacteria) TaxID=192944 RepID=UPI00117A55B1|nr:MULTISPECIES: hypothetical protein [unclassified Rhodococcus (in: high G+C Gram-positive bacteria)]
MKFKKSTEADEDVTADWMIKALEGEKEKIARLALNGAQSYVMITNAKGTAHWEAGRIDKVQFWMDSNLAIPGKCYWRDDVDRRLDRETSSLKLKYSEMLTLQDGVEIALSTLTGGDIERRRNALQAFIAKQFKDDATVKFKQVDMTNEQVTQLFVDVPVDLSAGTPELAHSRPSKKSGYLNVAALLAKKLNMTPFRTSRHTAGFIIRQPSGRLIERTFGTAELLLESRLEEHLSRTVIEGAPGQGKSTLAQYLCQIHRAKQLGKQDVIDTIPENFRRIAFRFPIKIDLRDFASFLDGNSPFSYDGARQIGPRSFENFVAELVSFKSGGFEFDVNDVSSLLKSSPVLIFLDGLDEVADLDLRRWLINEVVDAVERFSALEADVQVIVTSRPSIFGNVPSFTDHGFLTVKLDNLDEPTINRYADKWIAARNLEEQESLDVKKILGEKLRLPHIRELTRNPMQLTILLTLIHQVGHSLPDQRTDLYRRYVDLFLTREADKSSEVREHRQVLLEFIQKLAWILQAEAESAKGVGSISTDALTDQARMYLKSQSLPEKLADDLFGGGLERVFVLVARIQGQYEFEVQPLREYFAAQHLYQTAPVGTYRDSTPPGDRAQRFEATALNPFWMNVCRFYAGCYSSGELGTLVLSLEEMISSHDLGVSIHARRLGLALLQDWVFSSKTYAQDKLVRLIFDQVGLSVLEHGLVNSGIELNVKCGRDTLRDILVNGILENPTSRAAREYANILLGNGGNDSASTFYEAAVGQSGSDRTTLIYLMCEAMVGETLDGAQRKRLIAGDSPDETQFYRRISVFGATFPELTLGDSFLESNYIESVLRFVRTDWGGTGSFTKLTNFTYAHSVVNEGIERSVLSRRVGVQPDSLGDHAPATPLEAYLYDVFRTPIANDDSMDFSAGKQVKYLVDTSVKHFGVTPSSVIMSLYYAGIPTASYGEARSMKNLFDPDISLAERARSARMKRATSSWWLEQKGNARNTIDVMLWAGLVALWSSPSILTDLSMQLNEATAELTDLQFECIRGGIRSVVQGPVTKRADRNRLAKVDLRQFSPYAGTLVAEAFQLNWSSFKSSPDQNKSDPLGSYLGGLKDLEKLKRVPSQSNHLRNLRWLQGVSDSQDRGLDVNFAYPRITKITKDRALAESVIIEAPTVLPEAVSFSLETVESGYVPKVVSLIADNEGWSYE